MERIRPNEAVLIGATLGLLALSFCSFSKATKRQVIEEQNGIDPTTGQKCKLTIHHRLPMVLGGNDTRENAIGLERSVHTVWDNKALHEGIIYPGIPIKEAPEELFRLPRKKCIFKYRKKKKHGRRKNS